MSNTFVLLNNEELFQFNGGFDGNGFFGGAGAAVLGAEAVYTAVTAVGAMAVVPPVAAAAAIVTIFAGCLAIGLGLGKALSSL